MDAPSNKVAAKTARGHTQRTEWKVTMVLFACNLLASFMQSIMNIALDQVSTEFHVRLAETNLVIIAFAIVASTVITTAASVVKRFCFFPLKGRLVSCLRSTAASSASDWPLLLSRQEHRSGSVAAKHLIEWLVHPFGIGTDRRMHFLGALCRSHVWGCGSTVSCGSFESPRLCCRVRPHPPDRNRLYHSSSFELSCIR